MCRSVESYELLPSRLRLVDRQGSELGLRELEGPFAEVELVYLGPERRPTYLVTVDLSVGAGAYNGAVTRFAEVSHGALHWLTAFDASGHVEEVIVMSSLRTAWRVAPRKDGRGQDILFTRVDVPDSKKQSGWRVTYVRFTFDEGTWHQHSRTAIEQWDEGAAFPPSSRFP